MGKALDMAERFYACFAASDFSGATATMSANCMTVAPAGTMNPAAHEAFASSFKHALPDARMEIVKAVESGSDVFVEARFRGTHKADLVSPQGTIPASGNTIDVRFADYFKVQDGKIVEHHVFWDSADMMAQLGATPSH